MLHLTNYSGHEHIIPGTIDILSFMLCTFIVIWERIERRKRREICVCEQLHKFSFITPHLRHKKWSFFLSPSIEPKNKYIYFFFVFNINKEIIQPKKITCEYSRTHIWGDQEVFCVISSWIGSQNLCNHYNQLYASMSYQLDCRFYWI